MTADLENLLPSHGIPVEYVTTTDGTVAKEPSVCVKTKKKIKMKKKSTKGNEFFKEGFQQGYYQQSIETLAKGILIGLLLSLVFFLVLNTSRKQDDFSQNVPDDNNSKCHKRIIGYYNGARKITQQQIKKLTHIIFNGIQMQKDGKIDFGSDEQKLMFLDMKNKAKNMKSNVQLMFATDAYKDNNKLVAPVMAEPKSRKTWINSVALFLLEEQLDGVEIVYRWPKTLEDEKNFASFVRELRFKLEKVEKLAERKVPYIIGILSHSYDWTSEDVPLLDDILNYVDFLNVETNNFYAPWHRENEMAGPLSPLYSFGNDNKSIDSTMNAYTCKTMKPSKLNIILTFGGAHWENVSIDNTQSDDLFFNIDVLVTCSGTRCRWQKHSGTSYAWRSLETLGLNLEEASWHNVAKSPYIWHPNRRSFLTFENERSLEEKMEYILSKNLGGVTIDRIDQDDDWNTLLNAVTSMDMCSGSKFKKEEVKYDCGKL
ncbi:unnamed protein product [Caenorhabditis brenneri]